MLRTKPCKGFKPRCASAKALLLPPQSPHPSKHGREALLQPQELAGGCFLGHLSGWQTWDGAGRTLWVQVCLAPVDAHHILEQQAGTSSGIMLRPGVLLCRSSGDIFVRAMVR